MTTKETREQFVIRMRTNLELNNIPITENKYNALQELNIRMNVYIGLGRIDKGKIDFPEAKRTIYYNFDNNINSSYINLIKY